VSPTTAPPGYRDFSTNSLTLSRRVENERRSRPNPDDLTIVILAVLGRSSCGGANSFHPLSVVRRRNRLDIGTFEGFDERIELHARRRDTRLLATAMASIGIRAKRIIAGKKHIVVAFAGSLFTHLYAGERFATGGAG